MAVHVPSLLAGSAVSGMAFLVIHREISHRNRLSTRWALAERTEEEFQRWKQDFRSTLDNAKKTPTDVSSFWPVDKWNEGVDQIREFLKKRD